MQRIIGESLKETFWKVGDKMLYFKLEYQYSIVQKATFWEKIIDRLLSHFVPMANPTLEENLGYVKEWYLEYDDVEEYTNREVGVAENGLVVFKAPFEENWGYWCDNDMTMDDYRNLNIHSISKEAFEKLWNEEIQLPFGTESNSSK